MVPGLGKNIYGAKIWIGIGHLSFQLGELAKLCLVLFFADILLQSREKRLLQVKKF